MIDIEAIVTALGFIAVALFFGQIVCAGFVLPRGKPAALRVALVKSALSSLLAFFFISLLALLVQGAKIQHAIPAAELLWRYVTLSQSGRVWLARIVYAALLVSILCFYSRGRVSVTNARWLALLALPLVASHSLMSHAVAVRENAALAIVSDAIHSIVTALWAGGLLALWRALTLGRKENLPISWSAEIVKRFSRLALASVTLIVATGLYQSWIHVGSFATLLNTDYGKTLLLKLTLFIAMLGLGALNLFSTKPLLNRSAQSGEDAAARRISGRRIALESCVGVLIFLTTGLLTALPPGVHALHQAAVAQSFRNAVTGGGNGQKPKPAEGASVKILSPAPEQIFAGDKVPLKFNFTKGKRGQHVHAYVDGELIGMFESKQGTLNGIGPGRHTLELRVVAEDHQTELDASDRVEFIVK